jgi:uncharacterized membrane protein YeaQ/YmgE (transglycosylase-associated protein family)
METLVWIGAGAALGWVSYAVLGFNEQRGLVMSAVIGAVGAMIGGKAIAPIFVTAPVAGAGLSADALLFAVAAAAACLALGNALYRRFGV